MSETNWSEVVKGKNRVRDELANMDFRDKLDALELLRKRTIAMAGIDLHSRLFARTSSSGNVTIFGAEDIGQVTAGVWLVSIPSASMPVVGQMSNPRSGAIMNLQNAIVELQT